MAGEVEIETRELRDKLEEVREEEQEAKALTQGWIRWVALTTAIMAVVAAIAALEASASGDSALLASNQAILAQTKASDTWTEYQANGLKVILRQFQASTINDVDQTSALNAEAQRQLDRQADEMQRARSLESDSDRFREDSEHSSVIRDHFAQAVAAFQVGIAMASVSVLTRRKEIWALGGAFGIIGAGLTGWGFTGAV